MVRKWYVTKDGEKIYGSKDVYAAEFKTVPFEVCKECPYYQSYGRKNLAGQAGVCYSHRAEAKQLGLEGRAKCWDFFGWP